MQAPLFLDTTTLGSTGGALSVTFAPQTTGTHEATLTLSSEGITGSVSTVIDLSGTVLSGSCGASLNWSFDSGTGALTITGTGDMTDYLGPAAPWSSYSASISSVELPSGLTSIGSYAFSDCTSLTSIVIPDSVTRIGNNAFSYCDSLVSAPIPESVTSIGNYAFSGCMVLPSVTLPSGITSIGSGMFMNCKAITSITIPASVTDIGSNAFYLCSALDEVVFTSTAAPTVDATAFNSVSAGCAIHYPVGGSGYTDTWKNAIGGLSGGTLVQPTLQVDNDDLIFASQLVGTIFPAQTIVVTATELTSDISCVISGSGAGAFSVSAATLGSSGGSLSVTFAPASAGTHTATLTLSAQSLPGDVSVVIDLSGSATPTSGSCGNSLAWTFDVATGVLTITGTGDMTDYAVGAAPWSAFVGDITSVVLSDGLTHIGNNAFAGGTNIASVSIPDSVRSIGESAFEGCSSLNPVVIPDGVTTIGDSAFSGCSSLESIIIPDSVTQLGDNAFENCSSLTSVVLSDSLTTVEAGTFANCSSLTSVTIPDGVTSIGAGAFEGATSLTSVTIPSSVTTIGESAFEGASSLVSVTLPESLTTIGESAFAGNTSLGSITIPSTVTNIGSGAFEGATSLDEVIFVGTTPPTVAPDAFDNVSGGVAIYFPIDAPSYDETWRDAVGGLAGGNLQDYVVPVVRLDIADVAFEPYVFGTTSPVQTITITGEGLSQDISCVVSDDIDAFALSALRVSPTGIPSGADAFVLSTSTLSPTGGSLTVSFVPPAPGSYEATLVLSSQGVPGTVIATVPLSGTASAAPNTNPVDIDPPTGNTSGSSAQGTSAELPQTSDSTNGLLLPLAVLIASGGTLALLGFMTRRRKTA